MTRHTVIVGLTGNIEFSKEKIRKLSVKDLVDTIFSVYCVC